VPFVRIKFSPLPDPTLSRQLTIAEQGRPETEEVLLESTRKPVVELRAFDARPSVFGVWTIDSNGSRLARSKTTYTFRPTTRRAPDKPIAGVEDVEVGQEGDVLDVVPVTTADQPKTTEDGGALPVPDTSGDDVQPQPSSEGGTEAAPGVPLPRSEVVLEVRTAPQGETDPANAIEVGHFRTDDISLIGTRIKVPVIPGETQQVVFFRTYDPNSDAETGWKSKTTFVHDPPGMAGPTTGFDFEDAWGSVTIEQMYGLDTMEVVGSELVNAEMPSMFASAGAGGFPDSVFSMENGASFWSMEDIFPYGRAELLEQDNGKDADFTVQAVPSVEDMDRIPERSIFAECYAMFRQHEAQEIQQQQAGTGIRRVTGASRDLSMFGSISDGSPIRVLHEVKCKPDGGAYGPYEVLRDPSRALLCRFVTPRITVLSHRGLRAPRLRRFWWRRRRRNRKWEYCEDFAPASAGAAHIFSIPSEVLTVFSDPKVNVTVMDTAPANGVGFDVHIDDSAVAGEVHIYVEQTVRGQESAPSGSWTATFAKAFAAAPQVAVGPSDATNESYAGFGSVSASSISGGYLRFSGGPGAGSVDYIARGSPVAAAGGGTLKLAIEIMGA